METSLQHLHGGVAFASASSVSQAKGRHGGTLKLVQLKALQQSRVHVFLSSEMPVMYPGIQ